jgi:hypothetical protein
MKIKRGEDLCLCKILASGDFGFGSSLKKDGLKDQNKTKGSGAATTAGQEGSYHFWKGQKKCRP